MLSRGYYIVFYIIYLILLALFLWIILYYSGVPSWIYSFFGIAILLILIGFLIKETSLYQTITISGQDITARSVGFWSVFYVLLQVIAFILIIIGLIFVIRYSTIPWWIWVIIAGAIIALIIASMLYSLGPIGLVPGLLFGILGGILFIIGTILLIIYSSAPSWVWIVVVLIILCAMLVVIFEPMSERNIIVVRDYDIAQ